MDPSAATTVQQYLDELPEDRRAVIAKVRAAVSKAMPKGFEEGVLWGGLCWHIPLKRYPDTYNKQPLGYVALAAQKNNYTLHLMGVYGDPRQEAALKAAYEKIGKKPDMGKSCVRFRKLEDLPLEAIAKLIASLSVEDYLALYEKSRPKRK
jgi:Domain of unknown function (DU1801)